MSLFMYAHLCFSTLLRFLTSHCAPDILIRLPIRLIVDSTLTIWGDPGQIHSTRCHPSKQNGDRASHKTKFTAVNQLEP
jgi:hypothetical protein